MSVAYDVGTSRSVVPRGYTGKTWPDEMLDELRSLQAKKYSASQIANVLSRQFSHLLSGPLTRCAVIGKLRRVGLSALGRPGTSPGQRKPRQQASGWAKWNARQPEWRPSPRAMIHPNDEPNVDFDGDPSIGVALTDLKEDQCRFIAGDTRAAAPYCGQPVVRRDDGTTSSYCGFHFRRMYRSS